jgi:hypothetical protein
MGNTLKIPSPTKLARLGHFPAASQAGRLAGPVFYLYVFSLVLTDLTPRLAKVKQVKHQFQS